MQAHTPHDKATILDAFAKTYFYYHHRSLPDDVLRMYASDVSDLPADAVVHALHRLRRDPKRRTMPLPADVRAAIVPDASSPEAQANAIAGAIVSAVGRYGYMRGREARASVGELAWRVIEAKGGWVTICSSLNASDGAFFAQCRELARSFLMMPQPAARAALAPADSPDELPPNSYTTEAAEAKKRVRGIVAALFKS